jgi:hypothetical protein
MDGFFKAPATGEYRFYISGDDTSELYLEQTPFDANAKTSYAEPTFGEAEKIADRGMWSNAWRSYFTEWPRTQNDQSDWI